MLQSSILIHASQIQKWRPHKTWKSVWQFLVLPTSAPSLQWHRGLRSCFPSADPTISIATGHLYPVDWPCNKFLHDTWLMATDLKVGQPLRDTGMGPPVKNRIAGKLIAMSNRELKEQLKRGLPASRKQHTIEKGREKGREKMFIKKYIWRPRKRLISAEAVKCLCPLLCTHPGTR